MNTNITLAKREKEILERVAWGGSYKEVANFLKISVSTVDNTLRRVKEKIGLSKVTELAAWWFCTEYDISFDLSPLVRKQLSILLLSIFIGGEIATLTDSSFTVRRSRRVRTENRVRRQETSINQPYII